MTSPPESDHEYGARIHRLFGAPPAPWVRETDTDHDVLVVGGGQAGVAIGFALRRAGIASTSVIDAASPGGTGVWTTIARMRRLRTPKAWPEPEFGFPELSFRAWYERRHGVAAYDELERIPRLDWAEYLSWVEAIVRVPVRHRTRLVGIEGHPTHVAAHLELTAEDGSTRRVTETTRKLVFANGVAGTGGPQVPAALAGLPRTLWAHTGDDIDFAALRGRRVAVVGAGASALDAVGTALEAGAAEVHLFTRRSELIVQGGGFPPGNLGARENFHRRSDADRWQLKVGLARAGRSCTLESVQRASAYDGFRVHLSAGWAAAAPEGAGLRVEAADGSHHFDFAIAGTGYQYDPATSPDLGPIAARIALWEDRYQPPAELADASLGRWPYLGEGYELQEKVPGSAPWLHRIHVFSAAAAMSFGLPVGDVASLSTGVPRLVDALGRDLHFEDLDLAAAAPRPDAATAPAGQAPDHRAVYAHAVWSPADEQRAVPVV
ncbi:SidA/IucD/PvdA family monooxygenase [Nocardioides nitrophenolicus]|uniref:SidA/IucD/PvdA family monooxygenase n=1 Tax=Nocardioides nitrophenolicus TaxID=60489 RepID=UPI00195CA0E5|nr:NAD(P)/FAD-dependent oxidoreductase [Nocardioides nitrophenolicus]MBM7517533.1 cation diffusion facilitator CzcD-associated flavoprotein CzcO [Nocardioides nitrophenolicus]